MQTIALPRFLVVAATIANAAMIAACSATVPDTPGNVGASQAAALSCLPLTCSGGNYSCGTASDGCGGTLHCGTCATGQVCNGNNCYPANCQPLTCEQVGASCNQTGDGCGGIIDCGTCPVGSWCNSINCVHLCSPPNCASPTIATTEFLPCSGGVCFMGNGNVGVGFGVTPIALGGSSGPGAPPYAWRVIAGSLPAGLTLDPSASPSNTFLHGTPTAAGSSTFTIQVVDDAQETAEQAFKITIGTGNLDSLAITSATYNLKKGQQLFVAANDPNIDAVLAVSLTATGQPIGTLHTFGTGAYNGTFTVSRTLNPTNVTVKSSRGATASSNVTVIAKY